MDEKKFPAVNYQKGVFEDRGWVYIGATQYKGKAQFHFQKEVMGKRGTAKTFIKFTPALSGQQKSVERLGTYRATGERGIPSDV